MQKGGWKQLDRVQDYLLETEVYGKFEAVLGKYELPHERVTELLDLTDAVMYGQIKIDQMPAFLQQAFGIEEDVAKRLAADVAGYRLLPLNVFMPGVDDAIKSWGGHIEDYPELRIGKPTLEDQIQEYAQEIGLDISDHILKRFVFLSKSFLNKERDREATTTLMKRPIAVGGLDMTQEQVDRLLSSLEKLFEQSTQEAVIEQGAGSQKMEDAAQASTEPIATPELEAPEAQEVMIEEEHKPEQPKLEPQELEEEAPRLVSAPEQTTRKREILPIKAVPTALTTEVPVISGHLLAEDEEGEVIEHKKFLQKAGLTGNNQQSEKQQQIVKEVLDEMAEIMKKTKLSRKSATALAESFIRGRMDEHRTHVFLQEKFGFDNDQIFSVLAILKKGHTKMHAQERSSVTRQARPVGKLEAAVLDERLAAMTSKLPKESIEPILPKARVSAARTKQEELEGQRKKIDAQKVKEAQVKARPEKANVRLSAPSVPPARGSEPSRRVSDVKKSPVLIGPVEELGTMSVTEFRRLSSDPKEAIEKILNTLQLLEETDYDDRVKGVQAWRKSPLNQLYLALVHESLMNGSAVADTAAKKRNAGEETLSTAEIDAIVVLNEQLHF